MCITVESNPNLFKTKKYLSENETIINRYVVPQNTSLLSEGDEILLIKIIRGNSYLPLYKRVYRSGKDQSLFWIGVPTLKFDIAFKQFETSVEVNRIINSSKQ